MFAETSFGVTYKVKVNFFTKEIKAEVGRKTASALSKAGAFIRRRASTSMRRRKRSSAAGTPPSVHSKDKIASLKNILFSYDRERQSVVVGPVSLNQVNTLDSGSRVTVPQLHEFGGTLAIQEQQRRIKMGRVVTPSMLRAAAEQPWTRRDLRRGVRPGMFNYRVRQALYPARPFMEPALVAEAPNFPMLWLRSGRAAA